MDITKMLVELRQEREQVEEAIMTLERVARSRGKRRGQPPAWMTATKRRGRPQWEQKQPEEPDIRQVGSVPTASSATARLRRLREG